MPTRMSTVPSASPSRVIALSFGGLLALLGESGAAADYTAGYLVEKSLSMDNVFVFLLIFNYFKTPTTYQHKVLFWGIVGAILIVSVLAFLAGRTTGGDDPGPSGSSSAIRTIPISGVRDLDPEGDDRCTVWERGATLVLWAPDYDGGNKAWVRFESGEDAIVGGSQIKR